MYRQNIDIIFSPGRVVGARDASATIEEENGEIIEDEKAVNDQYGIKLALRVTLNVAGVEDVRVLALCSDDDACIIVIALEYWNDFSVVGL